MLIIQASSCSSAERLPAAAAWVQSGLQPLLLGSREAHSEAHSKNIDLINASLAFISCISPVAQATPGLPGQLQVGSGPGQLCPDTFLDAHLFGRRL